MEESLTMKISERSYSRVWMETVFLAVINLTATFGNLSVCYAVYRNQRLRTPTNMFVVALAACKSYIHIYLLYAFFSGYSVHWQVDFRSKFLPISRCRFFHVVNDLPQHYGHYRDQPIFLRRETREVHSVV